MYVYIQTERETEHGTAVFTVGFYKPNGEFEPDSDYAERGEARTMVNFLNGGQIRDPLKVILTDQAGLQVPLSVRVLPETNESSG